MAAALKAARVQVAGEVHQERSCVHTRQHTACWAVCGWVLTVGAGMHTVVIIVGTVSAWASEFQRALVLGIERSLVVVREATSFREPISCNLLLDVPAYKMTKV